MAEDPTYGPYVRGKLALAGIDLSAPLATWLDSVHAIWAETPFEVLGKLSRQLIMKSAQLRPQDARETWGRLPEHRALAGRLGRGPGMEAGKHAGGPPEVTQGALDRARQRMRPRRH